MWHKFDPVALRLSRAKQHDALRRADERLACAATGTGDGAKLRQPEAEDGRARVPPAWAANAGGRGRG